MSGANDLYSGEPKTQDQMPTTASLDAKWRWKTHGSSESGANESVTGERRCREKARAKGSAARMYPDAG